MSSLIQKPCGKTEAVENLRRIAAQNEADIDFAKKIIGAKEAEWKLLSLFDDFRTDPTSGLTQKIYEAQAQLTAHRAISPELFATIKGRCLARTRAAVRAALIEIQGELTASRARDLKFEGETVGEVSPPSTVAMEQLVERCSDYIGRVETSTYEQLTRIVNFCLSNND
jgi:hypothetical protein